MIKTGQNIEANDFVIATTAGEALSARDAVYISTADGKAYKCDADDLTKMDFIGFAQEAAALNAAVNVVTNGLATGFSSLTTGAVYYLSTTAGAITATAPTNITVVGVAVSATVIKIERASIRRVVFTANGTWTKYPGLKYADIEVQGAGGDGATDGGGGGGGAYARKLLSASALSATHTITIGAAGVGSGNTSFGSLVIAGNGADASGGGTGGVASGGDINIDGQPGYGAEGGAGGNSVLGMGGNAQYNKSSTSNRAGPNGSGYGGGGAGGQQASDGSPSGGTGGTGTAGIVIVTEFYG